MGYTINAHFRPEERCAAAYWWPVLLEALRRHGMSLDVPRKLPEHVARYLPTGGDSDMDGRHEVPFRVLWDRLSDPAGRFHDFVSVWHPDYPGWEVDARIGERWMPWNDPPGQPPSWALRRQQQAGRVEEHAVLDLCTSHLRSDPEGGVAEESEEVAEQLLALLIAVGCEVAELCGPGVGELTYERYGVVHRFGAIGRPLELIWFASMDQVGTYEAPVARVVLPGGAELTAITALPATWTPGPLAVRLPGV